MWLGNVVFKHSPLDFSDGKQNVMLCYHCYKNFKKQLACSVSVQVQHAILTLMRKSKR